MKKPLHARNSGEAAKATRLTRQRAFILEELCKVKTHPTAEELYEMVRKRLPNISLGTIYRNLDFLASVGQVQKMELAGSIRRFDGNTHPHGHVKCVVCGKVADVTGGAAEMPIGQDARVFAEDFSILNARIEYEGLCSACLRAAQQYETPVAVAS